jgi:hypothetical protein
VGSYFVRFEDQDVKRPDTFVEGQTLDSFDLNYLSVAYPLQLFRRNVVDAVHLIDMVSLQPLALLRPPGTLEIHALAFSPDNTRLAAAGDAARLRIWNLPVLRQQLSGFGLDWQRDLREANRAAK